MKAENLTAGLCSEQLVHSRINGSNWPLFRLLRRTNEKRRARRRVRPSEAINDGRSLEWLTCLSTRFLTTSLGLSSFAMTAVRSRLWRAKAACRDPRGKLFKSDKFIFPKPSETPRAASMLVVGSGVGHGNQISAAA